jgi:hypothetical protein
MKTRWGSCNSRARTIWLNTDLARKPPECLEYVVVNELIQILEPTHNERIQACWPYRIACDIFRKRDNRFLLFVAARGDRPSQ